MYPEVEQYIAARGAAEEKYNEALGGHEHIWGANEEDCPRCKATAAASPELEAGLQEARDALMRAGDPLVRWIANNCWEYRDCAEIILRALPAPMSALNAIAQKSGWCETWDRFRARAAEAGVLPVENETESAA
jgi:hypothetical protein